MTAGPAGTRGGIRGLCIRRFRDQIRSMQWERIHFKGWLMPETLEMSDLFEPEAVSVLYDLLERARTPGDALKAWRERKEQPC